MTPAGSLDATALAHAASVAERAADAARQETTPRFRQVAVETKSDGSPVTEADREAERCIKAVLREAFPDHATLGEEAGSEGPDDARYRWIIDPIDGTIAFARGVALYATLIALMEDGEPVVGLIDLPGLDERFVGFAGGGCCRNGTPVAVSQRSDLSRSLVSHGDPFCFKAVGHDRMFQRMAREIPFLRGYTDAFGHAQVLGGGVDVMVDLDLNLWDAAATQLLVREAGGACHVREHESGKLGLVLGSPPLVRELATWFDAEAG